MKVTVKFFGAMRDLFDAQEKVLELDGDGNVATLVAALGDRVGDQAILDASGEVNTEIKMLVKGNPPRFLKRAGDKLRDGEVVTIFPPVIGG
jgi:molybdopterin converting factor small subunit